MQAPVMRGIVLALLLAGGQPAAAQNTPLAQGAVSSPILTLDQERLFSGTIWGKRILAETEAQSSALASENRRLESELTTEEAALTERRKSMEPAVFRTEADAFDAKVVAIRKAQDAKLRELTDRRDRDRQAFFKAVAPVMQEVVRSRGALAILDGRAILLAAQSIDATDDMIARIDQAFGDGAGVALDPAPATPEAGTEPAVDTAPQAAVPTPGAPAPAPAGEGN